MKKKENVKLTLRLGEAEREIETKIGKIKNLESYTKVIRMQLNDRADKLSNVVVQEKDNRESLITKLEQSRLQVINYESSVKKLEMKIENLNQ